MQKYHFFLNQRSIIFVKSLDRTDNSLSSFQLFEIEKEQNLDYSLFFKQENNSNWIVVCGNMLEISVSKFKKNFKIITAAGGFVETIDESVLFIFRNGVWDLPKGKVEEDETLTIAAIREVEEECGIKNLSIESKLPCTYHFYYTNEEELILKETHWYRMKTEELQKLTPQTEEGITKAEWVAKDNWCRIMENTYPSIELLIKSLS